MNVVIRLNTLTCPNSLPMLLKKFYLHYLLLKVETVNDIIIPPTIPTLTYSRKTIHVRGNINTLSIPTISRTLTINSKFRT